MHWLWFFLLLQDVANSIGHLILISALITPHVPKKQTDRRTNGETDSQKQSGPIKIKVS